MLNDFVQWAPAPLGRPAKERFVEASEEKFSGFVFKIQANMDPRHRDRIAFMRVCSGVYEQGLKMRHVCIGKDVYIDGAVTFMAGDRRAMAQSLAGDNLVVYQIGCIVV